MTEYVRGKIPNVEVTPPGGSRQFFDLIISRHELNLLRNACEVFIVAMKEDDEHDLSLDYRMLVFKLTQMGKS